MVNESLPSIETAEIPETLPVLPVRRTVVFPMAVVPLAVGQERSVQLIDEVMRGDRMVALVSHDLEGTEQPGPDDAAKIGTVAVILQLARAGDGTIRLVLQGLERIRIKEYTSTEPYFVANIERLDDQIEEGVETQGLGRAVSDLFRQLVQQAEEFPNEWVAVLNGMENAREIAYFVASSAPLDMSTRQEILEMDSVEDKLRRLVDLLQHEIAVREIGRQITTETQKEMSKVQRDYVLREQLKAIQKELGEGEGTSDVEDYRRKIEELNLPEEVSREAQRELDRLSAISSASPEYGIITTYLDWITSLPWNRLTGEAIDVPKARQVLDEDHYGLEKIKDRLIEYLAVRKLREDRLATAEAEGQETTPEDIAREPILCFVGPPGVGKTSLGQSIARALGRKFHRIALGGIRDEAEVRGHRRTYIGALPGRIIQGLRRVESGDPVFMLDEIDKLTSDWRGDPSSALLEVLDPAQNYSFVDNYVGVPFDLSKVLFIATANNLDTIPAPLLDRMEIIQLSGYGDEDKVFIAQQHLIPKQLRAHGLKEDELSIDVDAIKAVIRGYTREAGVRNLDREIASLARKAASLIAEGKETSVAVTPAIVEEYLGRARFFDETIERTERPGVATGMAWTPVGGDVLFVEATMMPSHDDNLIVTGLLGDTMKESAQAAVSYIRSNAYQLGVEPESFEHKTIHVHVPAGAIPKDGPSAGVTMATALASLVTGRCVKSDLAMTGEITLRGRVLPVGGIKEKVMAAHRTGVRTIILPKRNERDTEDIPQEIRDDLTIIPVDTVDQVLENALEPLISTEEIAGEIVGIR